MGSCHKAIAETTNALFANKHHKLETGLLLPLHNAVLLSRTTLPVVAGKPRSLAVVESAALAEKKQLIVAAIRPEALQKLVELETETKAITQLWERENLEDIYPTATLAVIYRMTPLPMGLVQLIVEGLERVEIVKLVQTDPAYAVKFKKLPAPTTKDAWAKGTDEQAIKSLWSEEAAMNSRFPKGLLGILLNTRNLAWLAHQTSVLLQQDVPTSQVILEEGLEQLLRRILAALQKELEVHKL